MVVQEVGYLPHKKLTQVQALAPQMIPGAHEK